MWRTTAAALVFTLLCSSCGRHAPDDAMTATLREHGVEIVGAQLMADGDVVRLNYRVVDYEIAQRSLRQEVRLFAEGAERPLPVMETGRLGPLRQRPTRDGRLQFMMFTNAGRVLRKGGRAVLEIGDSRIAGIPVS